jgi:hypothetical protein
MMHHHILDGVIPQTKHPLYFRESSESPQGLDRTILHMLRSSNESLEIDGIVGDLELA